MSRQSHRRQVIGLCGAIGSGKSVVRKCMEILWGIPSYDCDQKAKLLYYRQEVRQQLVETVGIDPISTDGSLDKEKLRHVLNKQRNQVEKVVHAALFAHLRDWMKEQHSPTVVVESAILYSSGLYRFCDEIITVRCDRDQRRKRVQLRNPELEDTDFYNIEELQRKERSLQEAHADYFLCNNGNDSLITQIEQIYNKIKKL